MEYLVPHNGGRVREFEPSTPSLLCKLFHFYDTRSFCMYKINQREEYLLRDPGPVGNGNE